MISVHAKNRSINTKMETFRIHPLFHSFRNCFSVYFVFIQLKASNSSMNCSHIEILPPQHKDEMFKCFLVFTKRLGCNLLHDEVPSGILDRFWRVVWWMVQLKRKKDLKYFTCATKLMVKKLEKIETLSMILEILESFHTNSWRIRRCHCHEKFMHK